MPQILLHTEKSDKLAKARLKEKGCGQRPETQIILIEIQKR